MNDTAFRVLLVDDVPDNLHLLLSILGDDYQTFVATNGARALQIATKEPVPDVILLDVMMPGMDGFEVCQRLKANVVTQDIPILFVTALAEDEAESRGLELGAADYIRKPFSPILVRARVRNHAGFHRARQQLAAQNQALVDAARIKDEIDKITRHDLKSPLTAVIGLPQMIADDVNLTPDQRAILKDVENAGYLMLEMINRSLDLYRMERGTYPLQANPVNLNAVVEQVIREFAPLLEGRQVRVVVERAENLPPAAGDKMLCHSMLGNLVKNAIEASSQGDRVTISLKQDRHGVAVAIHNRQAVDVAIHGNLFGKFISSSKADGSGLGCYSAALMAKTQRGHIDLVTSPAEGTRMTVWLPQYLPVVAL